MRTILKKNRQSLTITFVVMLAIILTSCSNQNARKKFGLNGNVKSCLERVYKVNEKFGKWENGDIEYYGHTREHFDMKGNHTETDWLDKDNELISKIIWKQENGKTIGNNLYDYDGKLVSTTVYNIISSNKSEYETYDNKNNKLGSGKIFQKNNKTVKSIYNRYDNNKIVDEFETNFEYDRKNYLISQKQINNKGEIVSLQKFEYIDFDKHRNWTTKLVYGEEKKPKNIVIREIEYY